MKPVRAVEDDKLTSEYIKDTVFFLTVELTELSSRICELNLVSWDWSR